MSKRIRPCQAPDLSAQAIPFKFTRNTDGAISIEATLPPEYLLYAAGLYGAWKAAEWVAEALPPCNFDLLGAVSLGT